MASFSPHKLISPIIILLLIFPSSLARYRPENHRDEPLIVEKQINFPSLAQSIPSIKDLGHHAGYYKLQHSKDARMFYYFFESRNNKSDPIVIWLGGKIGCSGSSSLFYEMGPFQITKDLSLVWNEYGWDQASNLIFVDQPIGTGFSYTTNKSDYPQNEQDLSNHMYDFLQAFFKEHPEFVKNDLYITGEYEMGYFVPAVASRINKGNKNKEGIYINLKGMGIGDGEILINSTYLYQGYLDYVSKMDLLAPYALDIIKQDLQDCLHSANITEASCGQIIADIMFYGKIFNSYDIRQFGCFDTKGCLNLTTMETFLNLKSIRDALGVIGDMKFSACIDQVVTSRVNLVDEIPKLLDEGISVLLYHGQYDLKFNWFGSYRLSNSWSWSGQEKFRAAPTVPLIVDGKDAGNVKTNGLLSLVNISDAASMVPMENPKASLHILKSWTQGKFV